MEIDALTVGILGLILIACLQWILASWRDLGSVTVAAAALLVTSSGVHPPVDVIVGLLIASVSAGAAWARAARSRVGRPDLIVVVSAVAACTSPFDRTIGSVAIVVVCVAVLPLALTRPRPPSLGQGRVVIEIPVDGPPPAVTPESAPSPS